MLDPAQTVIRICGGVKAVADMTGRDPVRVRRWMYPKDRGGTGGFIPTEPAQTLLAEAVRKGIPLRPEHFFGSGEVHPAPHGNAAARKQEGAAR